MAQLPEKEMKKYNKSYQSKPPLHGQNGSSEEEDSDVKQVHDVFLTVFSFGCLRVEYV